ncbi:peptidoglycan editing factor PgeF [Nocardioides sp.]|uniref:peptidoglycan editing factor PgeF n=1 Tax=Nocardioides sp. TaxID=35761 RepID=UPI001A28720D|nr:peptidoglycan editing factor PgeF [Nocardioides sp.]MBJ7357913.1 peptidoglycan editing factor PgeF [Nocardioides sp.]
MYAFRTRHGPADLCFTDRFGGVSAPPYDELNLAVAGEDDQVAGRRNTRLLLDDFAPGAELCDLQQVHGADVAVVEADGPVARPVADAAVTRQADVVLMVRVADCVPVLFVAPETGAVAAAHCGRPGLLAGVVPRTIDTLRAWGDASITAWVGPHVCGACYEVPAAMQDEVATAVPAARATTSWGTPSLDIGAGVRAQLEEGGVTVVDVSRCTRESGDLYSYRRDRDRAGRLAGLVRLRGPA